MPEIAALATHMRGRGGELWAAEHEGGVVGMVAAYPAEDGWHLSRMYVAASHRGTGLAAALIACAETHARGAGAAQMVLWTDMLFARAHAFYEKCGYVRRGGLRALDDLSRSIEARYWKPLTGPAWWKRWTWRPPTAPSAPWPCCSSDALKRARRHHS